MNQLYIQSCTCIIKKWFADLEGTQKAFRTQVLAYLKVNTLYFEAKGRGQIQFVTIKKTQGFYEVELKISLTIPEIQ